MKTNKVTFKSFDGHVLAARLELPLDQKPFTYAIFAHCFTCNKNLNAVRNISRALTQKGIGVLRFDFTGLGESEGDFADTNFSSNVEDLRSAATFMEAEYGPVELMIGHSLGGAATLRAAGEVSTCKAVVTIGAPAEPDHVTHLFQNSLEEIEQSGEAKVSIGGRPFKIRKHFVDDLMSQDLYERIGKLKRALLVMHSPIDTTVGIKNAAKIYEAAHHPKSFITLDDADHLLSKKDHSMYAGDMIACWVQKYIKQPVEPGLKTDHAVVVRTGEEGYLTQVKAGRHAMLADEPTSVGGTDLGPTPYDYLLTALGACTSMTLRMYADMKKLDVKNITVHLSHSKIHRDDCIKCVEGNGVGKIDQIKRELEIEGAITPAQRERMMQIADRCPVHRTMHNEIEVVTSLIKN